MKYIVWREPHKSYNITQSGYFVSWRNKISNNFSENWIDANRYKTLDGAISRLGIGGLDCTSIESFIKSNEIAIGLKRELRLSKILNQEFDIECILTSFGRIEKVDDNGNLIGDAISEVKDFIFNQIKYNKNKLDNKIRKLEKITGCGLDNYTSDADSNFWDEWVNN